MAKRKEKEGVLAYYSVAKGAKAMYLPVPTGDKMWLLEFFHPEYKKWLYLDQGRGQPIGPWTEQRALEEMVAWLKGSNFQDKEGIRLTWRIRNLKTGEEILDTIVT